MVVHHPDSLHEGVADRGADEAESTLFQIFAQRVRFPGAAGYLPGRSPSIRLRLAADERPDVAVEGAKLFLNGQKRLAIRDRGADL